MKTDSPYTWLVDTAGVLPESPCIVDAAAMLTYREVLDRVEGRASELVGRVSEGLIVPVRVSLDAASIVEILALQVAGAVPLPFVGEAPQLGTSQSLGGAICVTTSGSEGPPKLVPLTYPQIAASVRSSRARLGTGRDDRWLLCLPLSHVGGLSIIWRTLEAGGSMIAVAFEDASDAINSHAPSIASLVPTMVTRLLPSSAEGLAAMRFVLVGGARLGQPLIEAAEGLHINLVPTYGLTEAGSQVTTAPIASDRRVPDSVGLPLDGMTVGVNGEGVVTVDGPSVFSGYVGEDVRRGPFVTNDLGRFDSAGRLFVSGRRDEVIISGGENVHLGSVRETIVGIDGVTDACVVGLDSGIWGTVVAAMIVTSLDASALDEAVLEATARHERPRMVVVTGSIPMLPNGKPDREAVRSVLQASAT